MRWATPMSDSGLIIGEALVDIVERPDGTVSSHPGGSPANVALGLARLGRSVDLLTSLGDDEHGKLVRDHVTASGVRLAPSGTANATSIARARLDDTGAATYDFTLAWDLEEAAAPDAGTRVVHTGSIAAVLEPGATTVHELISAARSHATITYDPNARPALMGDAAAARRRVEELVALADVVKVSDEDIAWLAPGEEILEVAAAWRLLGPAIVVVTRGAEGAIAFANCGIVSVSPAPVAVVDTVGAGDSFMSGLIDGLWEAGVLGAEQRGALADISDTSLREVLERCSRIAGITVSRAGANPPTREELGEALLESESRRSV